jgi:hypothetical protein
MTSVYSEERYKRKDLPCALYPNWTLIFRSAMLHDGHLIFSLDPPHVLDGVQIGL